MIYYFWPNCLGIALFIILFISFCAFVAYRVNADRQADDTEKKDFSPLSPWLAPITPVAWLVRWIVLAPWSLLFGLFLIIFPFILILFRPLPEDDPIKRLVLKIGDSVLEINTKLLIALGLHSKPIRF